MTLRIENAAYMDLAAREQWLAAQAARGWYPAGSFFPIWRMKKGPPRTLRYALTPRRDSGALSPEVRALYQQAGWTYVRDAGEFRLFAAEDPAAPPVFTDDDSLACSLRGMERRLWWATTAAGLLLAAVLAALLLGCLPALAEMKPLALDEAAQPPQEQYYTSDTHYEDPSLTVDIGEGRIYDTNYVYAVIRIADPSQIRTAMAYKYNSSRTVPGETMATANNAVLAINADYHNYYDYGYLVRQGVEYRMRPRREWDVLMIDQNGDLHVIIEPTKKKVEDWHAANPDLTVVNSFNFGPVVKTDGEWRRMHQDTIQNFFQIAGAKQYARMAVCQLDTLTYLIVSCESVLDEGSSGMTLKEFEECLQEVEGKLDGYEIKLAYNIDGGGSTTMVFHNKKINSLTNPKVRDLSDIIYFASIYSE